MKCRRLAKMILGGPVVMVGLAFSPFAGARPIPPRPPNVVIILADDAGYADFGFQGSRTFQTPNIDALAREGVVYSAAYAAMPFCSPSRAALLTGRYPQRFGYEFNLGDEPQPGVDPAFKGLDKAELTIGDRFRAVGYRTIAVGKWHLGTAPQFHPNARGFDEFYGFLGGALSYRPGSIPAGVLERNGKPAQASTYLTDDLAREAAAQITANRDRPFLLYLAFNAVHTPMEAWPEDEAAVAGIADPQRRRLAAMTMALDRAVGLIADTLRRQGLDRRTLVIFTNDNGGDRIGLDASNGPLRGTKGTLLEGGIRVPLIVRFPDGQGAGTRQSRPVSLMDIVPTALALTGAERTAGLDGQVLQPLPHQSSPRPLYWRYDNMAAVREGQWKLLRFPDRPPQLYDLASDLGETSDLATTQPDRVRTMMARLFAWETTLEHPRWHTGSYWSAEDVRRYDESHVAAAIAAGKRKLSAEPLPEQ